MLEAVRQKKTTTDIGGTLGTRKRRSGCWGRWPVARANLHKWEIGFKPFRCDGRGNSFSSFP